MPPIETGLEADELAPPTPRSPTTTAEMYWLDGTLGVPVPMMPAPFEESATTSEAMVEVTADEPAKTLAVLAPAMIETAPEETEVMVGFEERVMVPEVTVTAPPASVGFEESTTVLLVSVTCAAEDRTTE